MLQSYIEGAQTRTTQTRQALEADDLAQAERSQASLKRDLSAIDLAVGASLGLLRGVQSNLSGSEQNCTVMDLLKSSQENPAVPTLGSWINARIVVLALIFATMGIGFLISLFASTESQAVQFAMIALLFSVFFSGFILDLGYLVCSVQIIS